MNVITPNTFARSGVGYEVWAWKWNEASICLSMQCEGKLSFFNLLNNIDESMRHA